MSPKHVKGVQGILGYATFPFNQGRTGSMKIYYAKCTSVLAFEFQLVSEGNAPPSARRKTISPRQIHEAWKIFRQQRAAKRLSASRYIFHRLHPLERLTPRILFITLSDESLPSVSAPSFRRAASPRVIEIARSSDTHEHARRTMTLCPRRDAQRNGKIRARYGKVINLGRLTNCDDSLRRRRTAGDVFTKISRNTRVYQ